jgi:D-Tyr-tRNAtyr deacylase
MLEDISYKNDEEIVSLIQSGKVDFFSILIDRYEEKIRRYSRKLLSGEVITKDDESLTLKIQDGGSKIVFFSNSTQISKTTNGSIDNIEIGKQITVNGEQNSDGSYIAKTIQLSPNTIRTQK